jgi:hypothetical protein
MAPQPLPQPQRKKEMKEKERRWRRRAMAATRRSLLREGMALSRQPPKR